MKREHQLALKQLLDALRESERGPETTSYRLESGHVSVTPNIVFPGMTPSDMRFAISAIEEILWNS